MLLEQKIDPIKNEEEFEQKAKKINNGKYQKNFKQMKPLKEK
jgi:hypothetical protein